MIALGRAWRRLPRIRRRAAPEVVTRTRLPLHGTWPATMPSPYAAPPETPGELAVRAHLLNLGVHPGGHQ